MPKSILHRFWEKIDEHGPIPSVHPELGSCWIWQGGLTSGYGRFRIKNVKVLAHRFAYELTTHCQVPDELELDHLCRVRSCVNPGHMEIVTKAENILRSRPYHKQNLQTHCKRGHELFGDNLYLNPSGSRTCRICARESGRKSDRKRGSEMVRVGLTWLGEPRKRKLKSNAVYV